MNTIAPPTIEKFSWKKEILSLDIGRNFTADYKHWPTIRPRISEVKRENPERNYSTEKVSKKNKDFLIVTRLPDEKQENT